MYYITLPQLLYINIPLILASLEVTEETVPDLLICKEQEKQHTSEAEQRGFTQPLGWGQQASSQHASHLSEDEAPKESLELQCSNPEVLRNTVLGTACNLHPDLLDPEDQVVRLSPILSKYLHNSDTWYEIFLYQEIQWHTKFTFHWLLL